MALCDFLREYYKINITNNRQIFEVFSSSKGHYLMITNDNLKNL